MAGEFVAEVCFLTGWPTVLDSPGQGHSPCAALFAGWVTLEQDPAGWVWKNESLEELLQAKDNPMNNPGRLEDEATWELVYGCTRAEAKARVDAARRDSYREVPEIEHLELHAVHPIHRPHGEGPARGESVTGWEAEGWGEVGAGLPAVERTSRRGEAEGVPAKDSAPPVAGESPQAPLRCGGAGKGPGWDSPAPITRALFPGSHPLEGAEGALDAPGQDATRGISQTEVRLEFGTPPPVQNRQGTVHRERCEVAREGTGALARVPVAANGEEQESTSLFSVPKRGLAPKGLRSLGKWGTKVLNSLGNWLIYPYIRRDAGQVTW